MTEGGERVRETDKRRKESERKGQRGRECERQVRGGGEVKEKDKWGRESERK